MTSGDAPRDDAELAALLARQSPLSTDYANLGLVEPPSTLDDKILALAKVAAKPTPKAAPRPALKPVATPATGNPAPARPAGAAASAAVLAEPADRRNRPRAPPDDDEPVPARRPAWLVPAALAASVVVAVGLASVLMRAPSEPGADAADGAVFARRARERVKEDKAAAAAASAEQEAEVVELEMAPLPPPPIFEADGPQVEDLDAAIAVIRKELVRVSQVAAAQEEARLASPALPSAAPAGRDSAEAAVELANGVVPASGDAPGVVQPRERRLAKILELYDRGDPDLAGDSLEIFLRDFEDDPIRQRILGVKP